MLSSGSDLMLSYLPFFVAKTETPSNPIPRSVRLRSLADFARGIEEGPLLCPVRALHLYLQQTEGLASRSSSLSCPLVSLLGRYRKMPYLFSYGKLFRVLVLFWILRVLCVPIVLGRRVSTSVSFLQWKPLVSKVLEATTWKSNLVFAFYLIDISYVFEGLRLLGPFVATGQSLPLVMFVRWVVANSFGI